MKFIALSFLLIVPPTYADRGGNASWTQDTPYISTHATKQASEMVVTTAATFPSASITPSPSVSVTDSNQTSQEDENKLLESTILNAPYSSSVQLAVTSLGASSRTIFPIGVTHSNVSTLYSITSSVPVKLPLSSPLNHSSGSSSMWNSISSLLDHRPKEQKSTLNSTLIEVSSYLAPNEDKSFLTSTLATIPNTFNSTYIIIQSTQSNQGHVTESMAPSLLVHKQSSSEKTIELPYSNASFSLRSTYTKLFQGPYTKEPSGKLLGTSNVAVTSPSPNRNFSLGHISKSVGPLVTTTDFLYENPSKSMKSIRKSEESLGSSLDTLKITSALDSTWSSAQPLKPNPLLTTRHSLYLHYTTLFNGSSTVPSAVFPARITANSVQDRSDFSTPLVETTRVVTIRSNKARGLPPWAVITVAVGAFLFVCLIAIVAFKIVQWNKDHGDYKLWSTDLELTPITSRNAEVLT